VGVGSNSGIVAPPVGGEEGDSSAIDEAFAGIFAGEEQVKTNKSKTKIGMNSRGTLFLLIPISRRLLRRKLFKSYRKNSVYDKD
jgi:hypothetical protein